MARRLKVLFLTPYPPYPPRGGGEQRIYQMLRLLGERHKLHLLTLARSPADGDSLQAVVAPLRAFAAVEAIPAPTHTPRRRLHALLLSRLPDMVLRGQEPRFAAALASSLARHDFDVVQAESIEMAQYGRDRPGAAPPLF